MPAKLPNKNKIETQIIGGCERKKQTLMKSWLCNWFRKWIFLKV